VTAVSDHPADGSRHGLHRPRIVQGAILLLLGALLVVLPERSLTLVAVLTGMALCATGLFELARAGGPGLTRPQRVGTVLVGLLSVVAGGIVIARPEGSIRALATVAGLYLIIRSVATAVLRLAGIMRDASLPLALVGVAAGIALVAWPDISVGVFAVLVGLLVLAAGAAELWAGLVREPGGRDEADPDASV